LGGARPASSSARSTQRTASLWRSSSCRYVRSTLLRCVRPTSHAFASRQSGHGTHPSTRMAHAVRVCGPQLREVEAEVARLKPLAHANIVRFVDVLSSAAHLHLVMECASPSREAWGPALTPLTPPCSCTGGRVYACMYVWDGGVRQSWKAARWHRSWTTLVPFPSRSRPCTSHSAARCVVPHPPTPTPAHTDTHPHRHPPTPTPPHTDTYVDGMCSEGAMGLRD
jgi:hypothetical protein